MTVFFVGKNDKATNNYSFIYNTPTNTNATFVNNNDRYSMFAGTQVDNLSITGTNQSNIVISAVYNGASSAFVQNGSTIVTGFNPGTNGITGGLVLGQWYIQDNKAWGGKYCELLMFSNVLSTEDRQTTEGYLAWKWGLQGSLPTTHPYKFQSPASNYSSAVVPQGLLINFDAPTYSGSGQWINRGALGTSFNATITAGQTPTKNVAGNGIVFNGSSGWTFANIGQQTSFTISSWIKRTAVIPDYVALVSDGIDSGTQINMALMGSHPTIPITNTDVQGGFYDGTWRTGPSVTLTSNTWVHVTATFDTTTKNLITYANGVRTNTTQFSGLTPNTGGRLYRIGQHITNVPLYFTGEIGQVLIYNRALTSTEVTQNYAVTSTIYTNPAPPSLVTSGLLIRFDATTYSGSGTWSNAGSLGTGYNASVLSGSPSKNTAGNGVVITNNLEYRFTAPSLQTTWTMSSWFKRTGTCPGDCAIVCEVFANNTINMCLGANGLSANTFAGGFYSGRWYNSPTATPSLNAWTHLCVTYNGTTMTLYINGTASSSNTPGGTIGTANSGQYRINVSGVQSLVGEIGQILIYGRALTASEVAQNYAATNTAFIA
jgi:hypothetical protein